MNTIKPPIVVAFDGSDDSTRALHWAIEVAERAQLSIRAVVVAMDPGTGVPVLREYEQEFAASAASMARDLIKHGHDVEGTVVVQHGLTVPALLEEAQDCALMVVGSRGHGVAVNHLLGSVSQHLAGHAPCPVAVIRPAHNIRAHKILVGIDGSDPSRRALEYACERAAVTGEEVVAVHAYQLPAFSAVPLAILPQDIDTTLIDSADRLAAELVAGIAGDYPDVSVRSTAVIGRPARVLARLSDDASLVVVGSRGRHAFAELLLGSVAQEVLHRAACSVVVVR